MSNNNYWLSQRVTNDTIWIFSLFHLGKKFGLVGLMYCLLSLYFNLSCCLFIFDVSFLTCFESKCERMKTISEVFLWSFSPARVVTSFIFTSSLKLFSSVSEPFSPLRLRLKLELLHTEKQILLFQYTVVIKYTRRNALTFFRSFSCGCLHFRHVCPSVSQAQDTLENGWINRQKYLDNNYLTEHI